MFQTRMIRSAAFAARRQAVAACPLAAMVFVTLSSIAQATPFLGNPYIGVQFSAGSTSLDPRTVAGAISQNNFNVDGNVSGTLNNLVNSHGTATSVSLTYVAQSSFTTGTSIPGPNGLTVSSAQNGDPILLNGEDKTNPYDVNTNPNPVATYTLSGLANHPYNLIVYGVNDAGGTTSQTQITTGTTAHATLYSVDQTGGQWNATPTYVNGGAPTAAGATLGNFVEFLGILPVGGVIAFSHQFVSGGNGYDSVNGFQLATPEPSSFVLCGLGAIGLFLAARRRRKA